VSATSAGTAHGGLRVVVQMFYEIQWLNGCSPTRAEEQEIAGAALAAVVAT